jgi:hypothetical protein
VDPELAHEKQLERRVTYRLLVTNEEVPAPARKPRAVVLTYHNGARIRGNKHGAHPPIVISAREQDEVLWTGPGPFRITLAPTELKGPANPFFRTSWNASKGKDDVYRLVSGPVNPAGLGKDAVEYKFNVVAQVAENGADDDGSEPLDPHIIIEP